MAQLTVDLMSRDSLMAARAVIAQRLVELGEEPDVGPDGDQARMTPELAAQVGGDLWRRVGGHTRDLVQAFAKAEGPISLDEVAKSLDEKYETIKARKFRFGRTENLINSRWGVELLHSDWYEQEGANRYTMEPSIAKALQELAASEA